MDGKKLRSIGIFAASFLLSHSLSATVLVSGNSTATTGASALTFNVPVLAKVFDRANGTLYVGLSAGTSTFPTNAFAISKVGRPTIFTVPPQFKGIATNSIVSNLGVFTLALATSLGVPTPFVVGATSNSNRVFAISTDGLQAQNSAVLLDAGGAVNSDGNPSSGIVPTRNAVAANQTFIFAAVKPNGGSFGSANGGIAVVRINLATACCTVLDSLKQTAAMPGDMGIKARRLDPTTPEVQTATTVTAPTISPNFATLYWDDPLQRLYIGLELTTGGAAGDAAKSIVVARVDDGLLEYAPIVPDGALVAGDATRIVAAEQNATPLSVDASLIGVMHTSTGPSYLIVNGGNGVANCTGDGSTTEVGNTIYALPLVDDPTNPLTNGTIAKKDSALVIKDADLGTLKFVTPAALNADLPAASEAPVLVGESPFPLQPDQCISDMVVVGDTVYASSDLMMTSTNDSGVFYSQAIFDNTGKIARWTPWSKRAFPFEGIPGAMMPERIRLFEVDALSGNVWGIGGDTGQSVAVTQWDHGSDPTSLVFQVRKALSDGCYSVLDLDQGTRALGAATPYRYALFGGVSKIVFTVTSISTSTTPGAFNVINNNVPAPQTVTEDFSTPDVFQITTIPGNSGCVTCLEFSRRTTAQQNYFFAGTGKGLFVFTDPTGNGFTASALDDLNASPLSTGIWQLAPNIQGTIVDVKSAGQALYVLTYQTTKKQPFLSTLYKILFTTNISTMFDPSNIAIIAQSSTAPVFNSTLLFKGIQIVKTGASTAFNTLDQKEQLVLATNTGLYISNADQTGGLLGIVSATDQTDANWQIFDKTAAYVGVAGMDTPLPGTVWPFDVRDQFGFNTFERSCVHQLSGIGSADGTMALFNTQFIPAVQPTSHFDGSSTAAAFVTVSPIRHFFSDGARRFFIGNRFANRKEDNFISKLTVSPWNVQEWDVTSPANNMVFSPALITEETFYWVHTIGATGFVMAGTNNGVVALE